MTDQELRESIGVLYDMECNLFLMDRTIANLDAEISKLGHRKSFRIPTAETAVSDNGMITGWAIVGLILGGILVGGVACSSDTGLGRVSSGFGGMIAGGIIGAIIGGILGGLFAAIDYRNKQKELDEKYRKQYADYKMMKKADERRVEKELKIKDALLKDRSALVEQKSNSQKKLAEFYVLSGIEKEYRNIITIGYMNDFIRLRIATKLEGADGLYYLVKKELRFDQIGSMLNEISEKLDSLVNINQQIYYDLNDMSLKCDRLVQSSKKHAALVAEQNQLLREKTAIDNYNLDRIAKENEYQSRLMRFRQM